MRLYDQHALSTGMRAPFTAALYERMRACVRACTRRMGYDIVRYHPRSPLLEQRRRLLDYFGITAVIDVGANVGQYATQLRQDLGFPGRIVSFEPLPQAFAKLALAASGDPRWDVMPLAIGNQDGNMDIHVSENLVSSSFLEMNDLHVAAAPDSRYCGSHRVSIAKLDTVFPTLMPAADRTERLLLKIDTQGFEKQVIEGAAHVLPFMTLVQMELSLVPLYRDEELLLPMCGRMSSLGYGLVSVEPGFSDPRSGRLLQVDTFFARYDDLASPFEAAVGQNPHPSPEQRA